MENPDNDESENDAMDEYDHEINDMEECEPGDENGEIEEDVDADHAAESEDSLSPIEEFALGQKTFIEAKEHIGNLATLITTHPERNVKKTKFLILMLDIKKVEKSYKLIFVNVQKLVAFACLEVFKDIVPNYRVVEAVTNQAIERNKKLKKQTKYLWEFERNLLQLYKLYVHRLERMLECGRERKNKKSDFYNSLMLSQASKNTITLVGTTCLSGLLLAHQNFNYRERVIELLVSPMNWCKDERVKEVICSTISTLYKKDKSGEISLEIVKATAKLIKSSGYHSEIIATFLDLNLSDVKKQEEQKRLSAKEMREKRERLSRKQKKRQKEMQKLENQLLETDAVESEKRRLDYHTQILNKIFVTYFRILKFNLQTQDDPIKGDEFRKVLSPVLKGLSKFAKLINVEFFEDLISILYKLINQGVLDHQQSVHCLNTVFTILSGEGSALVIDPQRFYVKLYTTLTEVDTSVQSDEMLEAFRCLDLMILRKRKEMTLTRLLSFMKRLSTISLTNNSETAITFLGFIVLMLRMNKQTDIILDTEKIGSSLFSADMENPEYSNASATSLWELHLLTRHHEKFIRLFARFILNGLPKDGLKVDLRNMTPLELHETLKNKNFIDEQNTDIPSAKKIKKFHTYTFNDESLISRANLYLLG